MASAHSTVILGTGGHAASVADLVKPTLATYVYYSSQHEASAKFSDDGAAIAWAIENDATLVLGMGDIHIRMAIVGKYPRIAQSQGIVAQTATLASNVDITGGSSVHHHAHVGPDVKLSPGVIINTGAIVEHGASVGMCSHIAPGARILGDAQVAERCLIGSGAVVAPGVHVPEGCTVGAGAVVLSTPKPESTVVGIPARSIQMQKVDQ